MDKQRKPKTEIGIVSADKMSKTITVKIEYVQKHPMYGKYIRKFTKCKAHDEKNLARQGDKVEIQAIRPLSKTKRWKLVRILEKAG